MHGNLISPICLGFDCSSSLALGVLLYAFEEPAVLVGVLAMDLSILYWP